MSAKPEYQNIHAVLEDIFTEGIDLGEPFARRRLALVDRAAIALTALFVETEQIESLAEILWENAQNPSGPGDRWTETTEELRNTWRNRAARVLATGRVILPPPLQPVPAPVPDPWELA